MINFELFLKSTEKPLKGNHIVKFSLLTHHHKYNIVVDKGQEEMQGDQVKSHFLTGVQKEKMVACTEVGIGDGKGRESQDTFRGETEKT